ncbi:MAG: glycosyltransferase family 4 protein [Chloroflexi bacterium]|nr:glycosyltransferase family 4 protein [Chloroflexota bacterium]
MKILLPTDVFPPNCGGSGWSTYHLARALRERGHEIEILVPVEGRKDVSERNFDGFRVTEYGYQTMSFPVFRNISRNEVLYRNLAGYLAGYVRSEGIDLVHAQHSLTIPPAVRAALSAGVPVISTVRDYWPICYFSTMAECSQPCRDCSGRQLLNCLREREGRRASFLALFLPYMRGNVRLKMRWLSRSDRVVGVSRFVADRLRGYVDPDRVVAIPNLVDLAEIRRIAAVSVRQGGQDGEPFLLFVGKLERNKGAELLLEILPRERFEVATVFAGSGRLRDKMEAAGIVEGLPWRFSGWTSGEETLRLMARATILLFPSGWDEPLSRVLLEAMALGVPTVAMATGGTREIIEDGHNGLLATGPEEFGRQVRRLLEDEPLRRRLSAGAVQVAEQRFSKDVVVAQVERLYEEVLAERGGAVG